MASRDPFLVFEDLSGGWNTTDPPHLIDDNQVTEAENVEWVHTRMPQKRRGCAQDNFSPFAPTGIVHALFRHTLENGTEELWALTDDPKMGRRVSGTWAEVTLSPNTPTAGSEEHATSASLNDLLFLAYQSGARLKVWDGSSVRLVGLSTPDVVSVVDVGSGSYAATTRYYRQSYIEKSGTTIIRRSELGASQGFTPSGTGTHARVTRAALLSEGETHWELWVSADDVNYFLLATTLVATTTYDDNSNPTTYTGTVAPVAGTNTVPNDVKYVAAADSRLFLAGSWNAADEDSRVWWTPQLGESGIGDLERVPTDNYVDVDPSHHGNIRGLHVSPLGDILVWKQEALYRLVSTGNLAAPYQVVQLSGSVGLVHQHTIVDAMDATGATVVAWISDLAQAWQLGPAGLQYLGRPVQDFLDGWNPSPTVDRLAHGVFYREKQQILWWVTRGTASVPDDALVYHTRTGAWSRWTGTPGDAMCSAMVRDSAESVKPYIGRTTAQTHVLKLDTGTQDISTDYAGIVTTKAMRLHPMSLMGVVEAQVMAEASASATIQVVLIRDFSLDTRTLATLTLTASASETHVILQCDDAFETEASYLQFRWRDVATTQYLWHVVSLIARVRAEGVRTGNRAIT